MAQSIEIQRLRGIREGKVEGLAPLTVLVGPSGAGKSTVLDALLILFSRSPGDAVGRVIRRRAELTQGAPWLFHRRLPGARIRGVAELTGQREAELSWSSRSQIDMPGVDIRWVRQVTTLCAMAGKTFTTRTAVAPSNQYLFDADYQDGAQQAWSHEQAFLVARRRESCLADPGLHRRRHRRMTRLTRPMRRRTSPVGSTRGSYDDFFRAVWRDKLVAAALQRRLDGCGAGTVLAAVLSPRAG